MQVNIYVCGMCYTCEVWTYRSIHSEFCIKLMKIRIQCMEQLKLSFERTPWAIWNFLRGSTTLKMGTCLKKVKSILDILHQAETKKWKQDLVTANWRLTLREVAAILRISFGLCQEVLSNNLVLRSVSGNFVPRQMTAKQKQHLLSAAFSFLKCAEADENLFKNAVTVDKTWVYRYDPKTKHLLSNC